MKNTILYIILYLLTLGSTYFTGGVWYMLSIMTILTAHELGHYFTSKRYGVSTTFPIFIPFPFSPFGTLGAIIKMKGNIPHRKALFDIGAAGPIMGLLFAFPITIIGLKLSTVIDITQYNNTFRLGEPLFFKIFEYIIFGPIPKGYDILLHPIAYAGWVGFFVTALNLLPIGQLDGGHILYALFGKRAHFVSKIILFIFGVFSVVRYKSWLLLIFLLILMNPSHPPTIYDYLPIDRKRILLGILMGIVFVLSFTPMPFLF